MLVVIIVDNVVVTVAVLRFVDDIIDVVNVIANQRTDK